MRLIYLAAPALLLAGCASDAELMALDRQQCINMGLSGEALTDCQKIMYSHRQAERASSSAAMAQASATLLTQSSPQPVFTQPRPMRCTSQRNAFGQVITNCW